MSELRSGHSQGPTLSASIWDAHRLGKHGTLLLLALAISSFGVTGTAQALAKPVQTDASPAKPHGRSFVSPRLTSSPCWGVSYRQAWTCINTYGTPGAASIVRLRTGRYGVLLHSRGVTVDGKWNGQRVVYWGRQLCRVSC